MGRSGVSRRGFLGSVAGGLAGAVVIRGTEAAPASADPGDAAAKVPLSLEVNGRQHQLLVEGRRTLLDVLRDQLGLTGTKLGCGRGECGACTVLIGDAPRYACLTLALEADGSPITTLEGLMRGEELGPVQQAFVEEDGFQCGYCTPGQVMAVEGLLRKCPAPTLDQVREGVSGNLCRCGAYAHIFNAGLRAATLRREGER
jgi:xanthine dehydrogenase YagT iron-sulfur-binding subunit